MSQIIQYTTLVLRTKHQYWELLLFLAKVSVLVLSLVYLIEKVDSIDLVVAAALVKHTELLFQGELLLLLPVLLMPINWILEAKKWQVLSRPLEDISFKDSFKAVLAGLSLGFVTPHAIGDYAAKVLYLRNDRRYLAVGPVFLGRAVQMFITAFFGCFGLGFLFGWAYLWWIFFVLFTGTIIVFLLLVALKQIKIEKIPGFLQFVLQLNFGKVFLFSLLRYLVFTLQMVISFYVFGIELSYFVLFCGATWIFLIKSILPSFNFLSDLGLREFSAIYFFSSLYANEVNVIGASLFVWFVNLLIPTLIGLFFVIKIRLNNE